MQAGIIGCGVYIPRLRIKREEYQRAWGYFSPRGVEEKSVAGFDEDSITMGVEAASNALRNARVEVSEVDAVYFASTSPPYAEKENASTIATALACRSDTVTVDLTSSIRSGTSALLGCLDFVSSERGKTGLVVAADCPLGDPTAPLEHQLGAAAAAIIMGRERASAMVEGSFSITRESIGERFRRDSQSYVTTVGIGPYYDAVVDEVVTSCVKGLMEKLHRSAKDYDWFVLQGLDDIRALLLSKKVGFDEAKTAPCMISTKIGDTGTASPLLALSKVLESALSKQLAILCSYAPGAGADAVSLAVEGAMKPGAGAGYEDYLTRKEYIDYTTYLKHRRIFVRS